MSDTTTSSDRRKTAIYLGWEGAPVSEEVYSLLASTFDLLYVHYCAFGEKLDQAALAALAPDFLFSFGPLIVRKPLLEAIAIAAINFHTAPPRWPGRGSCSLALLAGEIEFGVTAHLMAEAVDAGRILKVLRFPIDPDETVETLHHKALSTIPALARLVVGDLASNGWTPRLTGEVWARKAITQRELLGMMCIKAEDPPSEIERTIRAFAHSTKPGPYVVLHGHRFWYLKGQ